MLMSTMSSLNISISISIRKELMLMLRLSSLAHKLLMLMFTLMLVSLVRTGLKHMLKGFLTSAEVLVPLSIFPEKIPPLLLVKKQRTYLSPSMHSMTDAKSNTFLAH